MNKILIVCILYICQCVLGDKPNILLIVMDDLGYADIGYNGGDFPTPNIDTLANNGIRLNYHYAENVCSATRSALLTGRYAWKTGLDDVVAYPSRQGINKSFDLISDLLLDNGYDTLLTGKWHIGMSDDKQLPHGRGFKSSLYFTEGYIHYTQHKLCTSWEQIMTDVVSSGEITIPESIELLKNLNEKIPEGLCGYDLWRNEHESLYDEDDGDYSEDILVERIFEYLDEYYVNEKEDPFFIYWAMPTPHSPIIRPPEITIECNNSNWNEMRQLYCNMVYYADKLIGDIIDDLHIKNLYDNTLIIWLADNGAQPSMVIPGLGESAGLPLPFRGAKFNTFEGGIRTPALISGGYLNSLYDNHSPSCDYNNLVYVADFYAIIAGLLDLDTPVDVDGIDLWSNIEKECGYRINIPFIDITKEREEIISFRYKDGIFYRAVVIKNINGEYYKLLLNPNKNQQAQIIFNYLENWVDYDGTSYSQPNDTYYTKYNQFDINNRNDQGIFWSKCYEDYLDDSENNEINISPYIIGDDEIYLFKLMEDNIEACNIAQQNINITQQLLMILYGSVDEYYGATGNGEKGSYLAIKDSYDCNDEPEPTFFYVKSDSFEYQEENINMDWNEVLQSFVDKVDSCSI